ncbi:M3 family oligoendopeptidase [bacterium]|nr:M3 family oligoendopeptidase [bacterium]
MSAAVNAENKACAGAEKEALPSWDLSDLYASCEDPKIKEDLQSCAEQAKRFDEKWRKKFTVGTYCVRDLNKALQEYEALEVSLSYPLAYAHLRSAVESQKQEVKVLEQFCREAAVEIESGLVFFELALSKISDSMWEKISKSQALKPYVHYLGEMRKQQKYVLSEAEEKLMQQMSQSGRQAFARLFAETVSSLRYPLKKDGKTENLTQSELLALFHDPDRSLRRRAAQVLSKVLTANAHPIHFAYSTLILDKITRDRLRGYPRPESARNLGNEIDDAVVDTVIDTVCANYSIVANYYRLKAKLLGLSKLYHYDRYAPLQDNDERVSYDKAKELVLEAFGEFDPSFREMAERFFAENWIDAKIAEGKRGGAFCAGITPKHHPYVMLNYTGRLRDVQTLAHELGHGLHDLLAQKLNYFDYYPVLPLAETASTFAEMIVFEKLYNSLETPQSKLSLLAGKLEDTFATVFRQAAMFRFEQRVFNKRLEEGELSVEAMNELWQRSIGEMFGDSLTLGPDHAITWIYVPHFINTPFYVYAYAFGELLVYSMFARYRSEGEAFKKKYIKFLASGGSDSPKRLLQELGIDIDDRQFWQAGCNLIAERVALAQKLAEEL